MTVILEGGCRVTPLRGENYQTLPGLQIYNHFGKHIGTKAISLRVLEFASGVSPGFCNADVDEVLFTLEGNARAFINGWPYTIEPDTALYLSPGAHLTIDNPGPDPVLFISSRCPDPIKIDTVSPCTTPRTSQPVVAPLVKLSKRESQPVRDRWYKVLLNEEVGSKQVTQFIGSIPPGRAPDHYHHYEEVLCILRGQGIMWSGETQTPVQKGSCIYLPARQMHCLENIGKEELRLLGIFYPAGSPAVSYSSEKGS